jgi:hypothetical protein
MLHHSSSLHVSVELPQDIFLKFDMIWLKSDKNTLCEDLSIFIMLIAVQHILQLNSSKQRNHYSTSTAMLSSFALLTAVSRLTIQWECNAAFTCLVTPQRHRVTFYQQCTHFPKSSHLKILGPKNITWSKFHTQDPQIRCYCTKFDYHGHWAQEICTPLHYSCIAHLVKHHSKST